MDVVTALAEDNGTFHAGGPAPTPRTDFLSLAGVNFSGCQPRRYSSPMVAFCVHHRSACCCMPETHMLHPMHSRISSVRPSSILVGMYGSAIDGRAAPMMSRWPIDCLDHIVGLVNRPFETTGTCPTMDFTSLTKGRIQLVLRIESCLRPRPTLRSHNLDAQRSTMPSPCISSTKPIPSA